MTINEFRNKHHGRGGQYPPPSTIYNLRGWIRIDGCL